MTAFDSASLRQLLAAKDQPSECESLLLSRLELCDVSIETVRAAPPTRQLIDIFLRRAEIERTRDHTLWKGMDQFVEGLQANQDEQSGIVSSRSTQIDFIAYVTSTAIVGVIARVVASESAG